MGNNHCCPWSGLMLEHKRKQLYNRNQTTVELQEIASKYTEQLDSSNNKQEKVIQSCEKKITPALLDACLDGPDVENAKRRVLRFMVMKRKALRIIGMNDKQRGIVDDGIVRVQGLAAHQSFVEFTDATNKLLKQMKVPTLTKRMNNIMDEHEDNADNVDGVNGDMDSRMDQLGTEDVSLADELDRMLQSHALRKAPAIPGRERYVIDEEEKDEDLDLDSEMEPSAPPPRRMEKEATKAAKTGIEARPLLLAGD